tara:strand:- start:502 stop:915 length:414 start_codon:yes stop_codon:yes gene_type:complete
LKIRNATIKDKVNISRLYYELYPKKKPKKIIPINKLKFKNILLVAEEKRKIIGFVWANFIQYGFSKFGYIEELFINKKFRKSGIASSLIKSALKKFRNLKVEVVFVTAEKENKKAIKLYKKLKFKVCKGLWFYWSPK